MVMDEVGRETNGQRLVGWWNGSIVSLAITKRLVPNHLITSSGFPTIAPPATCDIQNVYCYW